MYISKSMSIKSIVEKYPETIPVFANIGFKGLDNPAVLQKLEEQGNHFRKSNDDKERRCRCFYSNVTTCNSIC